MTDPYYSSSRARIFHGDSIQILKELPDNSVDSIVTDPPYGLSNTTTELVGLTVSKWLTGERDFIPDVKGFMGKQWDAFVPPPAIWDECLRVLKPGGHLLAFFGSRTQDLGALSIRLAGFELRDTIAWMYGSGFPKSLNVSDAMEHFLEHGATQQDKVIDAGILEVTRYVREARDRAGWTNKRIDALFGTTGMAGHWTTQASQPAVPSLRQWEILKAELGMGDDVDHLVERFASNERPEDWGTREDQGGFLGALKNNPDAEAAGAWGTAMKPAYEPVVVARKPVVGTVSQNVLMYGTGALNIGGCRTGERVEIRKDANPEPFVFDDSQEKTSEESSPIDAAAAGRWPSNVMLDQYTAGRLDGQAGDGTSSFFYAAKASSRDRHEGLEKFELVSSTARVERKEGSAGMSSPSAGAGRTSAGQNFHPTVKPTDLMRHLCRLVTPPGGTILDPFTGSGSTGKAAILEGFDFIGVELTSDYLPIIVGRIEYAENQTAQQLF